MGRMMRRVPFIVELEVTQELAIKEVTELVEEVTKTMKRVMVDADIQIIFYIKSGESSQKYTFFEYYSLRWPKGQKFVF